MFPKIHGHCCTNLQTPRPPDLVGVSLVETPHPGKPNKVHFIHMLKVILVTAIHLL